MLPNVPSLPIYFQEDKHKWQLVTVRDIGLMISNVTIRLTLQRWLISLQRCQPIRKQNIKFNSNISLLISPNIWRSIYFANIMQILITKLKLDLRIDKVAETSALLRRLLMPCRCCWCYSQCNCILYCELNCKHQFNMPLC